MKPTTKQPRAKVPATPGARKLLKKLEALAAAPGTPDEGKRAAEKLERLKKRYDFTLPDVTKEFLFAGFYSPSGDAFPIAQVSDMTLAGWVKWAIEDATKIKCLFRDRQLFAQATPKTAARLSEIAKTISDGFEALWGNFRTFPTVSAEDRDIFLRGLYDGMMAEQKPQGERLPQRVAPKVAKAKRKSIGRLAGIGLHPYTVALDLGQQIRFCAPIPAVINQLEKLKPKELAA